MFASSQDAKAIAEAVDDAEGLFRSRRDIAHYLVRRFSKLPRGNHFILGVYLSVFLKQIKYGDPGGRVWVTNPEATEDPDDPVSAVPLHLLDVPMMSVLVVLQNPYMPPPFGWSSKEKCVARLATGPEV